MVNFFRSQLLTLTLSWICALVFIVLGGTLYSIYFVPFILLYSWIPGLVALRYYQLEKMRIPLPLKWDQSLLWSGLIPIGLGAFTVVLSLPFSQLRTIDYLRSIFPAFISHLTPFTMLFLFTLLGIVLSLISGYSIYLTISLGQEIMWRGYMWDKLKGIGFWRASLVMGIFSGFWHAPLILLGYAYPQNPYLGVLWMILFSICVSPLLLYYRIRSESILGPSIFNGVLSSVSNVSVFLFISPNYLWIGKGGVTGFIACILFNLLLFVKITKNPLLEYEL